MTDERRRFAAFWADELTALDRSATEIFGEDAVIAAIERVQLPSSEMTLAAIISYRQALKAELRRMVGPH